MPVVRTFDKAVADIPRTAYNWHNGIEATGEDISARAMMEYFKPLMTGWRNKTKAVRLAGFSPDPLFSFILRDVQEAGFPAVLGSLKGTGCTFPMQPTSSPFVVPVRNNSCLIDRVHSFSGV